MAWKLTVGGVDQTASIQQESGVRFSFAQNDRPTASFVCRPGYAPARLAEVVIYDTDGTTPLFGGLVYQRRVWGVVWGAAQVFTTIDCVGFAAYLDWCFISLTYTAVTTLGTVLTALVAALPAGYGITLSGTYTDSLAAFTWTNMRASDALRELSDRTGKVWTISPAKVLTMAAPGGTSAPVTLTDATPNCREVEWADGDDPPANTVLLACGPSGTAWKTESWTVATGETSWTTTLPSGGPTAGYVVVGGVYMTVGTGAQYEWDDATHTLSVGTATPPSAGTVITLTYTAQYPFVVEATSGASPEIQALYSSEDTLTQEAGQEIADGLLAQLNQATVELTASEVARGSGTWAPGQALTVNLTNRGLNATFLVTQVDVDLVSDTYWRWSVRATSSTVYQGSYLDQWREIKGGSSGTPVVSVGGGSVTLLTSPAYLGGSRNTALAPSPAAYLPVVDYVSFRATTTGSARVYADLWARSAGVGVTARLYNVTDATVVGSSSKVTATTATEVSFDVALVASKVYRLELTSDTAGEAVYGIGRLDAA